MADDGQLGRRRLLPVSQIALCGEMYMPAIGRWQLRSEVMSTTRFPAASAEEVVPLLRDAEALALDCPDPTALVPYPSPVHADRLEWLDRAIGDTLKEIQREENETRTEMMFATPGSRDYDFEFDMIAWIRDAYVTLQTLLEEKHGLIARKQRRHGLTR